MTLDRLPPELAFVIFSYACMDGGRTGCALSRVSRLVNSLSVSTRMKSVSVRTARQLQALHMTLETSPALCQGVRNLFITYTRGETGARKGKAAAAARAAQAEIGAETLCSAILTLTAPALRMLSISLDRTRFLFPPALRFPLLQSLTLHTAITPIDAVRSLEPDAAADMHTFSVADVFPALRQLHLAQTDDCGSALWPVLFTDISAAAPRLVDLRLSGVHGRDTLTAFVENEMGARYSGSASRIPPALRRLTIQHRELRSAGCGTGMARYYDEIEQIAATFAERPWDVRIEVLEEHTYGMTDVFRDWLARLAGRQGYWLNVAGTSVYDPGRDFVTSDVSFQMRSSLLAAFDQ